MSAFVSYGVSFNVSHATTSGAILQYQSHVFHYRWLMARQQQLYRTIPLALQDHWLLTITTQLPCVSVCLARDHRLCDSARTVLMTAPGDKKMPKFDSESKPLSWLPKNCHGRLGRRDNPLCQIWWRSVHGGLLGRYAFFELSFFYIIVITTTATAATVICRFYRAK